jgi:hypothetical protein
MVHFVDPESAKSLALHETVVFAELMGGAEDEWPLEVHVMRPTGNGLYEVERDDTGPLTPERARALIARIAAEQNCRYATIYPAENRWPPPWASAWPTNNRSHGLVPRAGF